MQRDYTFALAEVLGTVPVTERVNSNEVYLKVPGKDLAALAGALFKDGARLSAMFAVDARAERGCFTVYAVFSLPGEDLFVGLSSDLPPEHPEYPSVTPLVPAAHWYEREIKDMFGIQPVGHPDPRRLVLHSDWPRGVYPMRKDFRPDTRVPRVEGAFPFQKVEGEGVFQVPVGPIHAGIIEPGHFRFSVMGENVINLEARLFYTHRGIEKMCEGKHFKEVLAIAERICGVCAFSHGLAYARAIERLAEVEVPARADYIRLIGAELERLYNHIGDIGNICAGTGFAFGTMYGGRLKEQLMRLNETVTGSRFLRGLVTIGGVRRDIAPETIQAIKGTLTRVKEEFNQLVEILLAKDSFLNRAETTGILEHKVAVDLGVVGPVARAAGVDRDIRRDHPFGAYRDLRFRVPVYDAGDVLARVKVRMDEVFASVSLIEQALARLPEGPLAAPVNNIPAGRHALGYAESPRGEDVHWVLTGENNTIARYVVRSASYPNWPSIAFTVPGNIVPDFPLINKSYELCYACLDR